MDAEGRPEDRRLEERLAALEAAVAGLDRRLAALEASAPPAASVPPPATTQPLPPVAAEPLPPPVAAEPLPPPIVAPALSAQPATGQFGSGISAAIVLGWAGAAALVLAAAYLVRLGIEYGWITPARQILATAGLGAVMVGGGLALRLDDRPYASLLGAGGVAVLYLAVFGAHLYHHLIGSPAAIAFAVAIAALSLGLHAVYRSGIYVAFALAGSYATPLLVEGSGTVAELALYLAVWDLAYCAYALWIGRRIVVIAALYASLLVFDIAWLQIGRPDWETAAVFQLFQFVLFVSVAVALSVRMGKAMGPAGAVLHVPALLLFYTLEYVILAEHAPALAPWAAVAFGLALYAAWLTGRSLLANPPRASLVTIHGFGALVLVHALYLDATPQPWRPLVALALGAGAIAAAHRPALRREGWPYLVAAGLVLVMGWLELFALWDQPDRPYVAEEALALAYPALFYVLYFIRSTESLVAPRALLLGIAHFLLLVGTSLLVDRWLGAPEGTVDRVWLSLAWAAMGIVALGIALARGDRLLARSSLGIFALFAAKVLLFDLEEASPLVRVGCLAVLGVSLYAGGWLYRRVLPPAAA